MSPKSGSISRYSEKCPHCGKEIGIIRSDEDECYVVTPDQLVDLVCDECASPIYFKGYLGLQCQDCGKILCYGCGGSDLGQPPWDLCDNCAVKRHDTKFKGEHPDYASPSEVRNKLIKWGIYPATIRVGMYESDLMIEFLTNLALLNKIDLANLDSKLEPLVKESRKIAGGFDFLYSLIYTTKEKFPEFESNLKEAIKSTAVNYQGGGSIIVSENPDEFISTSYEKISQILNPKSSAPEEKVPAVDKKKSAIRIDMTKYGRSKPTKVKYHKKVED
jgi:hypothetical protein